MGCAFRVGKIPAVVTTARRRFASPRPVSAFSLVWNANIDENDRFWSRQSKKSGGEQEYGVVTPPLSHMEATLTNSSALLYDSGRSNTASITLNIAVLAPMPRANASNAMPVKPGFLASIRRP